MTLKEMGEIMDGKHGRDWSKPSNLKEMKEMLDICWAMVGKKKAQDLWNKLEGEVQ